MSTLSNYAVVGLNYVDQSYYQRMYDVVRRSIGDDRAHQLIVKIGAIMLSNISDYENEYNSMLELIDDIAVSGGSRGMIIYDNLNNIYQRVVINIGLQFLADNNLTVSEDDPIVEDIGSILIFGNQSDIHRQSAQFIVDNIDSDDILTIASMLSNAVIQIELFDNHIYKSIGYDTYYQLIKLAHIRSISYKSIDDLINSVRLDDDRLNDLSELVSIIQYNQVVNTRQDIVQSVPRQLVRLYGIN